MARKAQPGDGRALQRYRWWQLFTRSLFHLRLRGATGAPEVWSVDVRHGGDDNGEVWARLYRDGINEARSRLPARFALPGGTIEVATSDYGLKRCHYVRSDGTVQQLAPDPASAEGRRARLDRNHPALSRTVALVSVAVLAVALVIGVPQIVAEVSQIPPVADAVGTFTSPVRLAAWANIALVVAALVASTERALRLRYHWLLDGGLFDGES